MTHTELIALRNASQLQPGHQYTVTDYGGSFDVIMTAESGETFYDESEDSVSHRVLHYDLDENEVLYMKDPIIRVEGYFDWTDNVDGQVSNISFGSSNLLEVKDSSYIYAGERTTGVIDGCSNIVVGNSSVHLTGCSNLTIADDSDIQIDGSSNVQIGYECSTYYMSTTGCRVIDKNMFVEVDGVNLIGSGNDGVVVSGNSNVIQNDNRAVTITNANCNVVDESNFITLKSDYNDIENSSLVVLERSYGNNVRQSSSINLTGVNDNVVSTDNLSLTDTTAYTDYSTVGDVRVALARNGLLNKQADEFGTVLVGEFNRLEDSMKGNNTWEIVDGQWVITE